MPYCCQCGKQVNDTDVYCRDCGARQPLSSRRRAPDLSSLSPRTASLLCYIPYAGWIAAIIILASDRFRAERTVRFHAFQGLYLFVAYLMVRWVAFPFLTPWPHLHIHQILQVVLLGVWIFMLVKVSQDQTYSLPILGELAEKSLSER